MKNLFLTSQKGAVAVIFAIVLTVLMGFVGFAIDIGNLCNIRTRMQNAVDAAVCGGGLKLPDQNQAQTQANALITSNGFDPANATVTFTADTQRNPVPSAPEINCSLTNNVPTYFMGLFGLKTVAITTKAEGILQNGTAGGPFKYAILSGDPNNPLTLSGAGLQVTGSVHANNVLKVTGSGITISHAAEGLKGVNISGAGNNIGSAGADTLSDITIGGAGNKVGSLTDGVTNVDIPDYSQQIKDIAIANNNIYNSGKIFSGAGISVNNNVYVQGDATIDGAGFTDTGAILADGDITLTGAGMTISGSNQVCLYSENGNITVSGAGISCGNNQSSSIIYAPNGTVTFNGAGITFQGYIVAQNVVCNGAGLKINGTGFPVTSLPAANSHVKLIE